MELFVRTFLYIVYSVTIQYANFGALKDLALFWTPLLTPKYDTEKNLIVESLDAVIHRWGFARIVKRNFFANAMV